MRLKIYQIDPDKDPEKIRFEPLDRVGNVDPTMYRKVFDAEADVKDLEGAFALFNRKKSIRSITEDQWRYRMSLLLITVHSTVILSGLSLWSLMNQKRM